MQRIEKCSACHQPLTPGMLRCRNPKCKHWNVKGPPTAIEDSTVLLSDAKMGNVEYIPTGLVDRVFGGGRGVARTGTILLGGEPGAGKTTLCMQLCDVFCGYFKKESLYIANEQDAVELKSIAERLMLRHKDKIRIVKAMGGIADDIGDLILYYQPCFIILDSVTKWVGEDLGLAVQVAYRMKDYTVRLQAPSIMINQVTKEGGHAGLMQLQHAVDTCSLFQILEGEIDENGKEIPLSKAPRRIQTLKNRFGQLDEQFYAMTGDGLVEIDLNPVEGEEEDAGEAESD